MLAAVQAGPSINVAGLASETVLLVGGVAALAWQIKRNRREAPTGVEPWRATLLDFGIWVWVVCCGLYVGVNALRAIDPDVNQPAPGGANVLLLGSVAQASALAAQLGLLWYKRPFSPRPLNSGPLPARRVVGEAAWAWLAAYPIIAGASLGWQLLLGLAQKIWLHLETPPQEAVKILAQSTSGAENILLILFAVLVAPVTEELFFRAGLYRFLKSRLPENAAMVAASFLFALSHLNLESFLPLLVLGILLTKLYERTGHIAAPVLFHALFNLTTILLMLLFPESSLSLQPTS